MREVLETLFTYFWIVIHHRWIAALTIIVVTASGWVYVSYVPDKYKVETQILVDTKTVLKPLLEDITVNTSTLSETTMAMRNTLLTRANLEKVARETDLDIKVTTEKELNSVLNSLRSNIKMNIGRVSGSDVSQTFIFIISYVNENPDMAKKVIDSVLNIFMENILGDTRKDSDSAEEFIVTQIAEYESKLEEAENRIKIFKQENAGLMPEDGGSYYNTRAKTKADLDEINLLLKEKLKQGESLNEQIQELISTSNRNTEAPLVLENPIQKRIDNLQLSLDELLLKYTERHPDVISTKNAIEQLQIRLENETVVETGGTTTRINDAVLNSTLYQSLKLKLSETEAEIAAIRERSNEYNRRIQEMNNRLMAITDVEAKLKKLNRDYNIQKETYERLLKSKTSAEISRDVEQQGKELQFSVLEPPRVPLAPFSPNRLYLITVVLIAGIWSGVGAAILFEMLSPSYYTKKQIVDELDLPVAGNITMFWSTKELAKRRFEFAVFGSMALALLGVYAVLAAMNYHGWPF